MYSNDTNLLFNGRFDDIDRRNIDYLRVSTGGRTTNLRICR